MEIKKASEVPSIVSVRMMNPRTKSILDAMQKMKSGELIELKGKDEDEFRGILASYTTANKHVDFDTIKVKRGYSLFVQRD
jgi:hypothetical protein